MSIKCIVFLYVIKYIIVNDCFVICVGSSLLSKTVDVTVTSGANGFKVMDPFDWTKDKAIYQRWQLWSEKARLALDAMESDSERTKISYFHHWINGEGMGHIESWKNSKTLICQSAYDELDEDEKEGKYSSESIESYFTLFELLLAPKSNPLLAVEELHFVKQGFMTSGEFHSYIVKIAKRCQFPNPEAEERAIRNAIFLGMNSQQARDKAINLMNEEGKELTVEFLMNQLAVEDCNAHHKSLSQLDSSSSMTFAAYDHRQNKGRATNQNELVEGTRDRIILEHTDLQITVISLENPRNGREVQEMWKARAPARTEMCSQECKMQGIPQNRTLPQGTPIQEKRQES